MVERIVLMLLALVVPSLATLAATPSNWQLRGSDPDRYDAAIHQNPHDDTWSMRLSSNRSGAMHMGTLLHKVDAEGFRGKRVRFSASVRTKDVDHFARLWIRVDGPDWQSHRFDNMGKQAITGISPRARHSVEVDVPTTADKIVFGVALQGSGYVWIADVRLVSDNALNMEN